MKTQPLFSGSWSEVTSGERNEIVFERLNKIYGAYDIRTSYDSTLAKAFSAMVLLIGMLASIFFIARRIPTSEIKIPKEEVFTIQHLVTENPVIPKQTEQPIQHVATNPTRNTTPEVRTANEKPINDILPETANKNNPGNNGIETNNSPAIPSGGTGGENAGTISIDTATSFPDVMPAFPGGASALFHYLKNNTNIPSEVIELGRINEKIGVVFIVDKDGSITGTALMQGGSKITQLNNEALNVVNKMPKWEPGKQNGKPVKVRMVLPIRFEVK